MKGFVSILIILGAIGIFYFAIDPLYNNSISDKSPGIKALQAEASDYDKAIANAASLRQVRNDLISKYNNFQATDIARLEKMLPDGVDNIRLILDINGIAQNYGMSIKNIKIDQAASSSLKDVNSAGSIKLSFTVTTSYQNYIQFLSDLEKSLRLVDEVSISFSAPPDKTNVTDFNTTLQTYWLK